MYQIDNETRSKAGKIIRSALGGLRQKGRWVAGAYMRREGSDKDDLYGITSEELEKLQKENPHAQVNYCAMGALFYEGPKDWDDPGLQAATVLIFRQLPEKFLRERYRWEGCDQSFEEWLLSVNPDEAHSIITEFNDVQSRKTPVVNVFARAAAELGDE